MEGLVGILILITLVLVLLCLFQSLALSKACASIKELEQIVVVQGEVARHHHGAMTATREALGILERRVAGSEESANAALSWACTQLEHEKRRRKTNGS